MMFYHHLLLCLLTFLMMVSTVGCGDAKMSRKISKMDTETLERISKDYTSDSKAGQLIAEELSRRPQNPRVNQQIAIQTSHSLPETKTTQSLKNSLAHKLANINARGHVSPNHITVSRFQNLLAQMSGKFIENEQQIADMSVKAIELLENEGVSEHLINIMEGLNSLPVTAKGLPSSWREYRQYVALYVSARTKLSHDEAIKGLRAFIAETRRLSSEY